MQTIHIQDHATHRSVTTLPNGDIIVHLAPKSYIDEVKADWDKYNYIMTGKQVPTVITELSEAEREMCKSFYTMTAVSE